MPANSTRREKELSYALLGSGGTIGALVFGVTLLGAGVSFAGDAMAQVQQPGIGTQNTPGQVQTAPEVTRPNEPLSDTLSRSQGVVTPPSDVDPGIHATAPEPNPQTTPVIPPPGTPGGNPNVQPK